ncbi:hypothetical protein HY251_21030, partial [bacterium]|nr:hypothetical protein [bacterium]
MTPGAVLETHSPLSVLPPIGVPPFLLPPVSVAGTFLACKGAVLVKTVTTTPPEAGHTVTITVSAEMKISGPPVPFIPPPPPGVIPPPPPVPDSAVAGSLTQTTDAGGIVFFVIYSVAGSPTAKHATIDTSIDGSFFSHEEGTVVEATSPTFTKGSPPTNLAPGETAPFSLGDVGTFTAGTIPDDPIFAPLVAFTFIRPDDKPFTLKAVSFTPGKLQVRFTVPGTYVVNASCFTVLDLAEKQLVPADVWIAFELSDLEGLLKWDPAKQDASGID